MHRPGIASVQGNQIVLDGTTIEEFERYHVSTLKMVIRILNKQTAEHPREEQALRDAEAVYQAGRLRRAREVNKRIKFDD